MRCAGTQRDGDPWIVIDLLGRIGITFWRLRGRLLVFWRQTVATSIR